MNDDAIFYAELGRVTGIAAGYPLRSSVEELAPGDVSFVQLKNVSADRDIVWSEVTRVSLPSKRQPIWLTPNDIIFSARGTKNLAYPLPRVPPNTVCGPQFFVLTLKNTGSLLPEFLAWQINQKPAQDYFQREATGSHIPNIRRSALEHLTVVVPAIHKQNLIVQLWRTAQRERIILRQLIDSTEAQLEVISTDLVNHSRGKKR